MRLLSTAHGIVLPITSVVVSAVCVHRVDGVVELSWRARGQTRGIQIVGLAGESKAMGVDTEGQQC